MIQEYLFTSAENRAEIESHTPAKVTTEFYDIDNSACWIATYFIVGENEDNANLLSKVNQAIVSKYNPLVLKNGSAEYFNKMLFPHINKMERQLRKLLYLKSALNKGDKSAENIKDLESKDFGEIFALLFTDEQFIKDTRTSVNKTTWAFTKQEIVFMIDQLEEKTVWDQLLGQDAVPTLRKNFSLAKKYRNDVMHAHNIDAGMFRKAKKLFEQINKQLDDEIKKIIDIAESHPAEPEESTYNEDLFSALERQAKIYAVEAPLISALSTPHDLRTAGLVSIPAVSLTDLTGSNITVPLQSKYDALSMGPTVSIADPSILSQIQTELHSLSEEFDKIKLNLSPDVLRQGTISQIDSMGLSDITNDCGLRSTPETDLDKLLVATKQITKPEAVLVGAQLPTTKLTEDESDGPHEI